MAKTFRVNVTEDELRALIQHNSFVLRNGYSVEASKRIHDLTKRLNSDLEIEGDPRPVEPVQEQALQNNNW